MLVKLPLQQQDLPLKTNISVSSCERVKSVVKRLLTVLFWQKTKTW